MDILKILVKFILGIFMTESEYDFGSKSFNPIKVAGFIVIIGYIVASSWFIVKTHKVYRLTKELCPELHKQIAIKKTNTKLTK